ncbi:phage tail tape measure protein, lambda family [Meinhardsimonia xiamenensis]|jgi:hypothetical protein|uniref:Phage tail tape measure protein, lambda family n=1 Tax=Meinhardsimonia xiamenensis TaxID=990712 RepID=A0A1G9DZ18_9RHOB|nr:phage tail tape measure C-terminal domain-containing protein [Meinhardsimonia xiamenensis]PRX29002.1 lambda family phage tail tape measure protein [Meinhardsimonia xiamenensis]SDK69114.1 phage tail tape measure protein, lambda family [Meinhardsimonia xiamenensis]
MAEKRVSVRLVAVGGRQLKAELEDAGRAGERGFRRLSAEVQAANARLAGIARQAKLAAAAMAAAVAAAGVAMVRSGLETVDAQAKLAQSLQTTVKSVQVLARAADLSGVAFKGLQEGASRLTRRLSLFAENGGGPGAKAIERLKLNAEELLALPLDERIARVTEAIREQGSEAEQAALFSQLFGDTAYVALSRVDTATLRQAAADVEAFGVAVSEADADQIERTNDAISRLGLIWRGLSNQLAVAAAPALEAVADALAAVAQRSGLLGQAITLVFDNLARLGTYATTFAAFMAGRWVVGLAGAALSVQGLATALVVLRGALIRTGIGALIVGAGELIYQFSRLVQGAGGFGEALKLLGDVAVEVWGRIREGAWTIALRVEAVGWRMRAAWVDALAFMQDKWARFLKLLSEGLFKIPGMKDLALDVGLDAAFAGQAVDELRKTAEEYRYYAGNLGDQADILADRIMRPLESLEPLREAMRAAGQEGAQALEEAQEVAEELARSIEQAGAAAGGAGGGGGEAQAQGLAAVVKSLSEYAAQARSIAGDIGESLVNAFRSAEDAVAEFVRTGQLKVGELVTSIIADLARLAARKYIVGPLASGLSSVLGSIGASIFHGGGEVGGPAPSRMVPALAFAGAPRMHSGGWAGLRADEVPAILQRGERVLSRREAQAFAGGGGVNVTIVARDVESFRQSRTQVAADIARAVALGRRGL